MFKAKIAVVGPCEAGKTVLSNFLGDQVRFLKNRCAMCTAIGKG